MLWSIAIQLAYLKAVSFGRGLRASARRAWALLRAWAWAPLAWVSRLASAWVHEALAPQASAWLLALARAPLVWGRNPATAVARWIGPVAVKRRGRRARLTYTDRIARRHRSQ